MRHQEQNARIVERMSTTAMQELGGQNAMLWGRIKEMQAKEMETMMLLRKTLLDQGALEMQREQARTEAMLYNKLIEQLEVLAPVVLGKFLKAKAGSEEEKQDQEDVIANPPFELTLITNFFMELEPDQITELGAVLSIAQRAALSELQSGGVPKEIIPVLVGRVMNGLSTEQINDIVGILRNEKQLKAFQAIYRTRKGTLDWQKNKALEQAKAQDKIDAEAGTNKEAST
jgi:hypothetical protein